MNISVFSSSSSAIDEVYFKETQKLGRLIAQNKHTLIYGGAKVGLMGEVATSVKEHNGKVIGIIPKRLNIESVVKKDIDELIVVDNMRLRKAKIEELSDAFITLPGGFGTLEELLEIITLKQLSYHNKPVVILNINNFYSQLLALFEDLYCHNFAKKDYRGLYKVVSTPEEALKYIESYVPTQQVTKWI